MSAAPSTPGSAPGPQSAHECAARVGVGDRKQLRARPKTDNWRCQKPTPLMPMVPTPAAGLVHHRLGALVYLLEDRVGLVRSWSVEPSMPAAATIAEKVPRAGWTDSMVDSKPKIADNLPIGFLARLITSGPHAVRGRACSGSLR
jgi:hypothetical protein